jgi:hypothetical protein
VSESQLRRSPRELRDELEALIHDDLIGPIGGPEEELPEAPVDRYLVGMLAPRFRFGSPAAAPPAGDGDEDGDSIAFDALPEDDLADGGIMADEGEDGRAEDRPPALDQLVPSAFGLTFALDSECQELRVQASWGAYSRATSEQWLDRDGRPQRVWRRRECGGERAIKIAGPGTLSSFAPDPAEPEVVVRGLVRDRGGQRLVSVFLVNGQFSDGGRSVPRWLCQASLAVEHPAGEPVLVRRAMDSVGLAPEVDRAELAGLEMLYRDTVELAAGHGVGVQATVAPGRPDRGVRVETAAMPAEEVPRTDAPGATDFTEPVISEPFTAALPALDMKTLSEAGDAQLPELLSPLADAYSAWIDAQERRIDDPAARLAGHEEKARERRGGRRTAESFVAAVSARVRAPESPSAGRPGARRADGPAGAGRPAVLPDRWRQDRGVPRAHGICDRDPPPAGGDRRPRGPRWRCGVDALHAAAADAPAVPARGGPVVRVRAAAAQALREGRDRRAAPVGSGADADRAVGRAGVNPEPDRGRRAVGQAGATAQRRCARRLADAARPLPVVRLGASGRRDVEVDPDRGRTILSCSDTSGQCAFTPRNSPDEGLPVVVVDDEV